MGFKLLSKCSKVLISFNLIFFGVFSSEEGLAEITVTPASPYALESNEKVYYAFDNQDATYRMWVDTDAGFNSFLLTETSASYPNKMIIFDIHVTGASGNTVLGLFMRNIADTTHRYVIPIYAAEQGNTSGVPAACSSSSCPAGTSPNFLTARIANDQTLRVGFYPKDICSYLNANGGPVTTGCTGAAVNTPAAGAVEQFALSFVVDAIADGSTLPTGATTTEQKKDISLYFQNALPAVSCNNPSAFYIPGDGQIFVNTNSYLTGVGVSGGAQVTNLLFFFKRGGPPTYSDREFRGETPLGPVNFPLGGFTNTTNGTDNAYQMGVASRNTAGIRSSMRSPDSGAGSDTALENNYDPDCTFTQIRTTAIFGLLKEDKCFIATASYGGLNSFPVRILRKFRDRYLMPFQEGRSFVNWYYSWSPSAAEDLVDSPFLRAVVATLLLPIVALAFLFLYPVWSLGSLAALSFVYFGRRHLSRKRISLLLMTFVFFSTDKALGEPSPQPYIDQLKKELQEKNDEPRQGPGEFLEKERQRLRGEKGEPKADFIESVKSQDPEKFEKKPSGQFLKNTDQEIQARDKELDKEDEDDPYRPERDSAIQAVKEGRSELDLKRRGKIQHAFRLRLGALVTPDIVGGGTGVKFTELYTNNWYPQVGLFYEFMPFYSNIWGNFSFVGGLDYSYHTGKGRYQFILTNEKNGKSFGAVSPTQFHFNTAGLVTGAKYRMNALWLLRPHLMVAHEWLGYSESRSDEKESRQGFSTAFVGNAGVSLLLDWISRGSSWNLYQDGGVKHYYLVFEYEKMVPITGALRFGTYGFFGGLGFDL